MYFAVQVSRNVIFTSVGTTTLEKQKFVNQPLFKITPGNANFTVKLALLITKMRVNIFYTDNFSLFVVNLL